MNEKITQLIVGQIATNCWIYKIGEKEAAVIDPGDEADVIISALQKFNLIPKYILLTHGHFDHIGAIPGITAAYQDTEIAIHRLDSEYLGPDSYASHSASMKAAMGVSSLLDAFWPQDKRAMPSATRFLEEGDEIGTFTVLHLPGHTPGSIAFWQKEENIIFTGDTLFKSGYGRTDLPGGNEAKLIESLRRLFAMNADIVVCPGHGGTTTIGKEAT